MTNSKNETFFLKSDMFNISKNVSPVQVLEYIKSHSPISIWDLSKQLEINRNPLYYLLRNLEFAGVIKSRIQINKSNRQVRMIYYNKQKKSSVSLEDSQNLNSKKINEGDDDK